MTVRRSTLALVLIAAIASGCGGGGGGGGGGGSPTSPTTGGSVSETEPNDFTAQSVGTLSTTDIIVSGTTARARDVDLFRVTIASRATLLVSLDWNSASDLELTISNGAGIFVREVDTAGHPESCSLPGLATGTYTVRVGSFTDAATGYKLTLGQR